MFMGVGHVGRQMLGAKVGGAIVNASPTVDLTFVDGSNTLDPRITFTRASTATYFDSSGVMQTAATNAPRFDYDPVTHVLNGLLIEEARTNLLLNSATLGTQSVAVTAQAYTLSFYGTGTVTMSGAFAGTLVGSGAFPARVQTTFTPAAGTLTCTVTGSVLNAQLEAGAFPTSYIPTTGAAATRVVELATMPTAAWYNATAGTIVSEMLPQLNGNGNQDWPCLTAGDGSNLYNIRTSATIAQCIVFVANANTGGPAAANLVTFGVRTSIGVSYDAGTRAVTLGLNGGTPATATASSLPVVNSIQIGLSRTINPNCWHRRVRYWPRVLSNAEMQSVTT